MACKSPGKPLSEVPFMAANTVSLVRGAPMDKVKPAAASNVIKVLNIALTSLRDVAYRLLYTFIIT